MDDISAAVGISAPALYRHFSSKQALLGVTIDAHLLQLETVVKQARDIDELAETLAASAVDSDDLGALLLREAGFLPPHTRTDITDRLHAAYTHIAGLIVSERQAVDSAVALILARSVVAMAISTAFHDEVIEPRLVHAVLVSSITAVCRHSAVDASDIEGANLGSEVPATRPWLSRSEAILADAPRMFRGPGGYEATTLELLGAAAGISGPSVYRHFGSKADIYRAVSLRVLGWAKADLERALSMSASGEDVIRRAMYSYTELAPWLSLVAIDPAVLVANDDSKTELGVLADRCVELWTECARTARPDLTDQQIDVVLRASLTLVHTISGGPRDGELVLKRDALAGLATLVISACAA